MTDDKALTISNQVAQIAKFKKELTPEQKETLKATVAKGATDDELALFMAIATQRGLNPFNRQIYFIKRRSKGEDGEWEDAPTIQTGIDGFRSIADNTETYAPSPKATVFQHTPQGQLVSATAFVMKYHKPSNQWVEFSATAFYSEYAQKTKAGLPTKFWREMPRGQLEKCAEAKALRKGWPEKLGGLYTFDEMAQADNPAGIVDADYKVMSSTTLEATGGPTEGIEPSTPTNPLLDAAKEHGAIEIPDMAKLNKKYGVSLEFCWLEGHDNANWKPNKFGKLYHKTDDGFCNFSDAIKPIVAELAKVKGWDAGEMSNILKEKYEGRTWSKLTEDEQVLFLESLIGE